MKMGTLREVLSDDFEILLILPRPKTKPTHPGEFCFWFNCDSNELDIYDERDIRFIEHGERARELHIVLEEE